MKNIGGITIWLLAALAIIALAQAAQAGDWPMFRHDAAHTGATNEVVEPPLELLWKFRTDRNMTFYENASYSPWASSSSSPAVYEGIVYVGSWDNYLYALDADTGNLKWKYKTESEVLSSPAVYNGIVYVGLWKSYLYALDARDGTLKWKFNTSGYVGSSDPVIYKGTVYVSSSSYVNALDADTGNLKWKYKIKGNFSSSPAVSNDAVYVSDEYGFMYALDADTGELKWIYRHTDYIIYSSPMVFQNVVYIPDAKSDMYALDADTGRLKWKFHFDILSIFNPISAYKDTVYVGSVQHVYALDAIDGGVKWVSETLYAGQTFVSGDIVYLGDSLSIYALDANNGSLKWKYEYSKYGIGVPIPSLAISGGRLYLSSPEEGYVYAFAPQDAVADSVASPSKEAKINWALVGGILLLAIFLIGAFVLHIPTQNKKETKSIEKPKPAAAPSEDPDSKSQAVLIEKSKEPLIKKPIESGTISVKSAYEYKGAKIYFKIKIENNSIEPVSDIKVHLFVPDVFLLAEKEKAISMLEPKESKTVTFEIRPTGECGDCNVSGKVEYYDYSTKGRKMLDTDTKTISVICPVLKRKEIDVKRRNPISLLT